ncbi:MAG: ABC transporter permease subunit [Lachnospiraceae bacterium]|nr:ABC transporter permease subunit [Lachnospiraceae bacterium]
MKPSRIIALFKREMLDVIRDKKTIVMMVLIPVLLYPLMIVGMALIMNAIVSNTAENTYRVAFDNVFYTDEAKSRVKDELCDILTGDETDYTVRIIPTEEGKDCAGMLEEDLIDAYISAGEGGTYNICYYNARDLSAKAADIIRDAFEIYSRNLTKEMINLSGLPADEVLNPISFEKNDLSTAEESMGSMLGYYLPFMIITAILLGAVYPSIDVTAGEKERGTLETMLTLPVTNLELIISKFLAVSVIAVVSALLNILSMGGAVIFLVLTSVRMGGDSGLNINFATFVPGILFTLLVMVFFALLVAAVCMCSSAFAKSFKEANNYATPVLLLFMFASMSAMIPNIEFTRETAAIPVVNVSLMIKSLFAFKYDYGCFFIVLVTNALYAALAVIVLAKLYKTEDILFSESFHSVRLFTARRDMKGGGLPGLGDAVLLCAVTLVVVLYAGNFATVRFGFGGVVFQQLVIMIFPCIYAWYIKSDKKTLFLLKRPQIRELAGGLLLEISAYIAAFMLSAVLIPLFEDSASNFEDMEELLTGAPDIAVILAVALLPAIGEELFFRGFLMGTFRNQAVLQKRNTRDFKTGAFIVILTTVIFAAYHMSLLRFFTVGVVGLAATFVTYYTGSIFTGMLMHFINNLVSVLLSLYPDTMTRLFPFMSDETLSLTETAYLIPIALICCILGLFLLRAFPLGRQTRNRQ